MMSDSSQTLCKIPLHSINLTHILLMSINHKIKEQKSVFTKTKSLLGIVMFIIAYISIYNENRYIQNINKIIPNIK